MNANTILAEAEQRIETVNTQAHTTKEQGVEGLRREIGPQHYRLAQEKLPVIEKAIRETYLPFVARTAAIAGRVAIPLPHRVNQWLNELSESCTAAPLQVRRGIQAFERITIPLWMDGKTPDPNECRNLVARIRQDLNSWDGRLGRFAALMGWVSAYIAETGWPAAQPSSGTLAVEPPRPAAAVPVITDFTL